MQFDPTYDYGKKDLTVDRYLICWKFAELIKNLITLSGNAEKQKEWIGEGATYYEMAINFNCRILIRNGILSDRKQGKCCNF